MILTNTQQIVVVQRRELAELFGFETRNKYEVYNEERQLIGFSAEQQKGWIGFFLRQLMGHWRSFEVRFFDNLRNPVMVSKHPFRFFFQEFHVFDAKGLLLGRAEQRFGIFTKKFDVYNSREELLFRMRSGFFSFWTFPLQSPLGVERALIKKKWSGLLQEMFLDADNFAITFNDPSLTQQERLMVMAMSVFTDLQYFEQKAESKIRLDLD